MQASELFDFPESLPFASFFLPEMTPWEWVPQIKEALASFDFGTERRKQDLGGISIKGSVFIHPTVSLPPYCVIEGPAYLGPECELRPGVYIRGNFIAGAGCVLGNSCEFKNSLLLDGVQAPHFNYVGDSLLGNKTHLGAGTICANLRLDQQPVPIKLPDGSRVDTGLRKLGAIMGDGSEAGCNSILQPGCILGRNSAVISMSFSGYLPPDTMVHQEQDFKTLPR